MRYFTLLYLLCFAVLLGCEDSVTDSGGIVITDEAKAFADSYWKYSDTTRVNLPNFQNQPFCDYLTYEYWAATVFGSDGDPLETFDNYEGTIEEWEALPWSISGGEEKKWYLPPDGFTHMLTPDEKDDNYYEMIGKYHQFAPGWSDYEEDDTTSWMVNLEISPLRAQYIAMIGLED
ncbi:hypothetical protein CEE37_07095 [candidate division LCP-89 bacterium B3_LCP]|uniref:Fibrobacter succinogenes major paralogous domain-containing protein n=1 Tax=candidate division LCP-89 bacterium B3_LCP TaxID=2012998 RepID=A0A532V0Q3_UNCL8|nr:MAG: hypothetical protein CEE37_07095 [candidate division LCP-89 bacterium B3_LCP]